MSLITRCPACDTLFRVVPDQLRISEGWVRCGQCAEIFDASQQLQALPPTPLPTPAEPAATEAEHSPPPLFPAAEEPVPATEAPAPETIFTDATVLSPQPPPPAAADAFADTFLVEEAPPAPAESSQEPFEAPWRVSAPPPMPADDFSHAAAALGGDAADHASVEAPPREDGASDRPAPSPSPEDAANPTPPEPMRAVEPEVEAQALPVAPDEAPVPATPADAAAVEGPAEAAPPARPPTFPALRLPTEPVEIAASEAPLPADPPLSFMRPQRAASTLWQRPAMRAALGTAAGLLGLLLVMQVLLQQRDRIAAQAPDARPLLATLCSWVGCTVSPLRQIESIVIDGSSFGRIRDNQYRLTLGIRNTATLPLKMPALELSLTNSQAQTLARRVIQTEEFPDAPTVLAPGAEWNGALTLRVAASAGVQDVAGYGLFAFYP